MLDELLLQLIWEADANQRSPTMDERGTPYRLQALLPSELRLEARRAVDSERVPGELARRMLFALHLVSDVRTDERWTLTTRQWKLNAWLRQFSLL